MRFAFVWTIIYPQFFLSLEGRFFVGGELRSLVSLAGGFFVGLGGELFLY